MKSHASLEVMKSLAMWRRKSKGWTVTHINLLTYHIVMVRVRMAVMEVQMKSWRLKSATNISATLEEMMTASSCTIRNIYKQNTFYCNIYYGYITKVAFVSVYVCCPACVTVAQVSTQALYAHMHCTHT